MKRIFVLITLLLITIAGCINVTQPPPAPVVTLPAIVAFSASPTEMKAGESATLLWNVTGATSVTIDQGVDKVAAAGTRGVSPTKTTTYTLTATNSAGTNTQAVTLTIAGISILPGLERRKFPVVTLTPTVFDFIDSAPNAAWRNSKGAVTFNNGVQIVDDTVFGDGVKYPKTLIISCNQFPDFIQGTYPEITIPTGAHFVAKMSSPKAFKPQINEYCISFIGDSGGYEIPLQCRKMPDGEWSVFDIDLAGIVGKTGRVSIRAATAPGAYSTIWSQWIDTKIIR